MATGRVRPRWSWGMRLPVWWKRWGPGSTTSPKATMWSWSSCRAAGIACPAPRVGLLCASRARRPHRAGGDVHHHLGVSAFADHATVSRRSLVKVDRDLPLDQAALFGCAVLTGVGAVINTAKVPAGASVAVVGLGG